MAGRPGKRVQCRTPQGTFEATWQDHTISRAVWEALPLTASVNRWGDEIYFDVPVRLANTRPTRQVRVGDVAYWPDGPCLCLFFGKTPVSKRDEPRPASDVTVVGHTDAPVALLRAVTEGSAIELSKVERTG